MDIRACCRCACAARVDERTVVFLDVDETLLRASCTPEAAMGARDGGGSVTFGLSGDMAIGMLRVALQRVVPGGLRGNDVSAVAEIQAKAAAVNRLTARHQSLAERTFRSAC